MKRRLLATMFAVALALTAFAGPVLADHSRCADNMHDGEGMTHAVEVSRERTENGYAGMGRAITESCP